MKIKEWFVILTESEIKMLKTEAEIAVYRSIKSFSSNGKVEVALSHREIASRTKISHVYVGKVVRQLTLREVIAVVGKVNRLGGAVNVYKVLTQLTVNSSKSVNTVTSYKNKVVTTDDKVVTTDSESGNYRGTKSGKVKSKKVNNKKNKIGKKVFSKNQKDEIWKILNEESDKEIERQRRGSK